jgi:hypothetical protein
MPPLKAISWPLLLMPTPHWLPDAFRNLMRGYWWPGGIAGVEPE